MDVVGSTVVAAIPVVLVMAAVTFMVAMAVVAVMTAITGVAALIVALVMICGRCSFNCYKYNVI